MISIKLNGSTFELYNSIKELPERRYNAMQGYLMQDSGIGSTMADVIRHFQNLDAFLQAGQVQEALTERQNLQLNIFSALSKINFKSMAFACMVKSINGKQAGYDEDSIIRTLEKIGDAETGKLYKVLEDIKKNCIPN